jgi:hypothetical protein
VAVHLVRRTMAGDHSEWAADVHVHVDQTEMSLHWSQQSQTVEGRQSQHAMSISSLSCPPGMHLVSPRWTYASPPELRRGSRG